MTSTKYLIDTFQSHIPLCQSQRALDIENSLKSGTPYLCLGGKKIKSFPSLIRFKLGRGLRFIWHNTSDGLQPQVITTRQGFERTIKQIRKASFQ